jgi:DMSO reductase family type II enzyme heme b subunit
MKKTMNLISAPTGLQPGNYVKAAYVDPLVPDTSAADVEVEQNGKAWTLTLSWECPHPVTDASDDTHLFIDSAAFMAPGTPDANWITMGEEGKPVEAVLWRADRETPLRVVAEGWGTVERNEPPEGWTVTSNWDKGRWTVTFSIDDWPALTAHEQLATAVWRGAARNRAGLKSISPGWYSIKA